MELKHYKFTHYLLVNNNINILAKNNKQAYEILFKHYKKASNYILN